LSERVSQRVRLGLRGGINTYAYVGDGPLNVIDPDGLQIVIPVPRSSPVPVPIPKPWGPQPPPPSLPLQPIDPRSLLPLPIVILSDVITAICNDDAERCREADAKCYLECEGERGKGGRTNQGLPSQLLCALHEAPRMLQRKQSS